VILVEHDEDAILKADYVVDIGPACRIHGGEIIAQGTPADIMSSATSLQASICRRYRSTGAGRTAAS